MATYLTMKTRLALLMASHMTAADVGTLINRVHQEEVENYEWYTLRVTTLIRTKALKNAGTVAVTVDSTTVTGTSTAWASGDVGSFIRIGSEPAPLRVTAVASATSLTTEVAWAGATASGLSYKLFPLYYATPSDCQTILAIKRETDLTKASRWELDQLDPSRELLSDAATHWAPFDRDATNISPRLEFWPVNENAQLYTLEYRKGHTDLAADGDRPLLPAGVVENKALHDACMATFLKNGDPRWNTAADRYWRRYLQELEEAKTQDLSKFGVLWQVQDAVGWTGLPYEYLVDHDAS